MWRELAEEGGDSLLKELGEEAIKKAVSTFVVEGVKAVIGIWKEQKMERWKSDFKRREKACREDAADSVK